MAGVKMPPRQRMINMMYLVLTAMLAMNVSKEVLDAFAVLDADLVRSERAHEQRSSVEYTAFAEAARKFPERYSALNTAAISVKSAADSLVEGIATIKAKAMAEVEGRATTELVGKSADGTDSIMALRHVEAKDDREVITRLLVGSDPAAPIDGDGTAKDLKRRVEHFRERLKAQCATRAPELAASLDLLFDLRGGVDASGTTNNWESLNFYDVPLVAGIAHLSKLQADIRSAENDVVKWLYRQGSAGATMVSDLTSAVVPRSSVVLVGDTFAADVFLAAYDSKNRARITTADGAELPMGVDGKGKIRLRADAIGEHTVQGVIRQQGASGMEEFPFTTTYQVMAPLLVASPTKMNVLYRGVENPLSFSVPGVTAENVRPVIDNGRVYRKADGWYAAIDRTGEAHVSAQVVLPDGSQRTIGPILFRAKNLPTPVASVNGLGASDTRATIAKLRNAAGVRVKLGEGCEFDEPFIVKRVTVTVMRNGTPMSVALNNGVFTEEVKRLFERLRDGDRVFIEDIQAQLANGQGPAYTVAPLALKVIR